MKTPVVWTVAVLIESGSVLPVVPRISTNSDLVKMFEVPTVLEAFCFCRDGSGIQRNKKTSSFIIAASRVLVSSIHPALRVNEHCVDTDLLFVESDWTVGVDWDCSVRLDFPVCLNFSSALRFLQVFFQRPF